MAVPFDERSDLIWYDGKLVPRPTANQRAHPRPALRERVFEGERAYGGKFSSAPSIPSG